MSAARGARIRFVFRDWSSRAKHASDVSIVSSTGINSDAQVIHKCFAVTALKSGTRFRRGVNPAIGNGGCRVLIVVVYK